MICSISFQIYEMILFRLNSGHKYYQIQSKYEVILGAGHQSATVPFGNMSSDSANSFVTQEPDRTGN